ncbi:MAG: hypothetical protein HQL69_15600 [Magnetococcales bacterium]|nr:hypothetical protein [Magnetococcales bacterium]
MFNKVKLYVMTFIALLFVVAMPNNVLAVSLGNIEVFRTEANMFHGEIPITIAKDEKIKNIMVSTGNRTDYAKVLGGEFDASVVKDGEQNFIVITGKTPQETPFFTLLVSVDIGNKTLSRNFPVQFDGQITPLPPRKLSVSKVGIEKKSVTAMDITAKTEVIGSSWEKYLLWWVAGGVLAVVLFWIWWKQGKINDEDLLIIAREDKAKLPDDNWDTLLSNEDESELEAEPEMELSKLTDEPVVQNTAKDKQDRLNVKSVIKDEPAAVAHVHTTTPTKQPEVKEQPAPPQPAPQPVKQPVEKVQTTPQPAKENIKIEQKTPKPVKQAVKIVQKIPKTVKQKTEKAPPIPKQTKNVAKMVVAKADPKTDKKPVISKKEVVAKPVVEEQRGVQLPKPKQVEVKEKMPEVVSTAKPSPKPRKATSPGRLSPVIMQGDGNKPPSPVVKKASATDLAIAAELDNKEDLSIEAVMSSLEKVLEDKAKTNSSK